MHVIFKSLFLLVFVPIYSQNSISGTISNSNTNESLAYVNVYLPKLEKGTVSDENGFFKIDNLPSGNHEILFSFIGFESKSRIIKIPMSENLNIQLATSAIEMKDIIISTPFHKLQRDNVMKVEQENIKTLKANGAMTLADGIGNIAGVESITTGIGIGKPVIRGLSSNRVLVYVQGVRLENQQFGDEHGLGINDTGVESVEVIKGPASLLYGSDALGGVLYINPEKFANNNASSGDVGTIYFSNTQGFLTTAGVKSSTETFKFLFRGSVASHSDYKTEDYRVTNTRFKEQDFKAGIGYQKAHFKNEFRYNVNTSKLGIPEEIGSQSTEKTPLLPYQEITNHVFSNKSTVFFTDSKLDINLGFIYNDRKEFEEEHHHDDEAHEEEEHEHENDDILEAALHMKLNTINYDVKYHLPNSEKIETIIGVQGMNQTNKNYGEEQLIPDATTNDIGVLATSHIHFEKADVQLGVRFDNRTIAVVSGINKNFNSLNGAAGVKTNITKNMVARLNLATGFRSPNLAELTSYGSHEGTNRFEIGNKNLKSEQNFQMDLSIEYNDKHWEVFANGFYNTINNYIYLSPDSSVIDETPVYNYLQNDANLYGGEFGIHLHPHPIHWLHVESSFETVIGKQNNGDYLPLIPANSINNVIRVEFDKNRLQESYAFIKIKSTFNQNKVSLNETNTEGYNLLSAGIGGTVQFLKNNLTINISGNNLTNKTYINHLSRLKPDGIFNMGRNIGLGLRYHF
ncbi:TonB-dependent receptor [Pseudalgibacter alginicilyticus]|uniref:TonB-dependent receptor n=1 Tax=Pseudalgibacter alginicilyticus TaxID=1736674 RepID=A0A0P0D1W8_9FLAO|nr:TonB-dependent receptor [Pseudalgibacter alginicilyticus]ALJ03751.1 TonB-dependent receptor [Pseudalgibacter alginicilyticus]